MSIRSNLRASTGNYNSYSPTLKDSISINLNSSNYGKRTQYSSRLTSGTPTSNYSSSNNRGKMFANRGVSADVNRGKYQTSQNYIGSSLNSPKEGIDVNNLIYQQVEGGNRGSPMHRPITSSPTNSYIDQKNIANSSRRETSSVAPSNKFPSFSNYSASSSYNQKLPVTGKFLPEKKTSKKTLILDLDETLVHSAFKPFFQKTDILLNVELDRKQHTIHVLKRPGAEEFLSRMAKHYEVVIFTASLSPYANPLIDQLDFKRTVNYRLFREHCTSVNGMFIKDMKKLGRDLKDVIIVDVSLIYF